MEWWNGLFKPMLIGFTLGFIAIYFFSCSISMEWIN